VSAGRAARGRAQVKLMGTRERAADLDFSAVSLEEEVEAELKEAAVISMGTEISEADLLNIMALCDQARPGFPRAIDSRSRVPDERREAGAATARPGAHALGGAWAAPHAAPALFASARSARGGRVHGERRGWTRSELVPPCTDMQATATEQPCVAHMSWSSCM
jgi:hypothetical protein